MKAYIIYIATLVAAFALPAHGQTGNNGTKAAPAEPAMPYKLTTAVAGTNHGTQTIADNVPNGKGVVIAGSDTLVYGAPKGNTNATTVKLTVTPDRGYTVRTGYPKAYKTGDTETKVELSGTNPYTFVMPAHPVTIETAYAERLKSIAAVTLKGKAADVDAAIALLPRYIHITLETGRKDSLEVGSWTFIGSGESGDAAYDPADGAVNRFAATLSADLPEGISDAERPLFSGKQCTVTVANKAQSLTPGSDDKITVTPGTGDNLNSGSSAFNGTIESAEVRGIEVSEDVKDATLTLKDVAVGDEGTTIKEGADLTLRIEGNNNLGTLKVESGATVVLDKAKGASLEGTIENAGTFRDSTATVTKVTGDAALDIKGDLTGGGTVTTGKPIILTASTNEGTGTITFTWQKKGANGIYTDIAGATKTYVDGALRSTAGFDDQYKVSAAATGDAAEYRCLIERTVTSTGSDGSETKATTLLSTQPAEVKVKAGDTPPPIIPTYYTVTLPALEGFSSRPVPGNYSVEKGSDFSFTLTPNVGTTAIPIVTTSRGETLEPRKSDGKYIVSSIYEDIAITLTAEPVEPEEPDEPTANEAIGTESIRIGASSGVLNILTPLPATVTVYTLSGHSIRKLDVPAGDSRIELPAGFYIVTAGNQKQKVAIR